MGLPSSYIATLGIPQETGILNSDFGVSANHGYYVGSSDAVDKTITLPATPTHGDRIEIYGIGFGSDLMTLDGNGKNINWGSLSLGGPPFVVAVRGCHIYLVFDSISDTWTVTSDTVGTKFAQNGSPLANTVIISDQSGFTDISVIGTDSYVGRANGNVVRSIYNSTQVLSNDQPMSSATLTDVPGISFAIPSGGSYGFMFELGLTKTGGSAVVGVSVAFTGTTSRVLQNVTLTQSGLATYGGSTSIPTAVNDSSGRANGGPFPTKISGGMVVGSVGNVTIQVRVAAGGVTVNGGSWGRVWEGTPV